MPSTRQWQAVLGSVQGYTRHSIRSSFLELLLFQIRSEDCVEKTLHCCDQGPVVASVELLMQNCTTAQVVQCCWKSRSRELEGFWKPQSGSRRHLPCLCIILCLFVPSVAGLDFWLTPFVVSCAEI